jgi:adenylate cyclase
MRKTTLVSFLIALAIAAAFAALEQRRRAYYNNPAIDIEAIAPTGLRRLDFFTAKRMQRAEWATLDARFQIRGKRSPHPDIAIIQVDEPSLKALKQWPWPRSVHAALIEKLSAHPPKALMFDIFFLDPYTAAPQGDVALARETARYSWVVHSIYFGLENNQIVQFTPPYPALLEAMHEGGFVNAVVDDDGVLRSAIPRLRYEDQSFELLSLLGTSLYTGRSPDALLKDERLTERGYLPVNYVGADRTFPYFSYHEILEGKIDPKVFEGKAVLVGTLATGTYDHYPTPMSKNMPGVEFHANVIDNLIRGNGLREAPAVWTYAAIALFGCFCGLVLVRVSAWLGALGALLVGLGYATLAQSLFASRQMVLGMATPFLTLAFGYLVVVIYRFFTEEREKRWVKAAFGQYVSPKVLEVLMEDPSKLNLGGERRDMTVFFSDVAGFTSISERLSPEELVVLLNRYLSAMTEVVFAYDGYLNKYMGDGIMAFWNAPVRQADHAARACRCALQSMRRLEELNVELKAQGIVPLKARIGLNSGTMAVGNMGSMQKSDYTVMGDHVNLGSRLEGANKAFGTAIMISEFTYELVRDLFEVRYLDKIRVVGKAKGVSVYELLGEKGQVNGVWTKALPLYHQAIGLFTKREFAAARGIFLEVSNIIGHDKPSEAYAQRAELFIQQPPAEDWDGVFEVKSK